MALAGATTVRAPVPDTENDRTFIRWFSLKACVTAPSRIHVTLAMLLACAVCTENDWPYPTDVGADVIAGRVASVPSALNRYGGEKISAV